MTPNIDSKQMAIGICILYISELNQQQQQFVAQKMQFTISIYSIVGCGNCEMRIHFLGHNGVEYRIVIVKVKQENCRTG